MSNTRRAIEGRPLRQERFASAPEFERGLFGNLVVKRCALIDSPATRELIWFVQYLSHQAGGATALAKELIVKFSSQIQTREMADLNLKPDKTCNPEMVKKIRDGLPFDCQGGFMLKGEAREWMAMVMCNVSEITDVPDDQIERVNKQPNSYPSQAFFDLCREYAGRHLESLLNAICLDPASNLSAGPWYFPNLFKALREHLNDYSKGKKPTFTTALGHKVSDVLDYTAFSRGLTLIEGEARTGKSFAARAWCEQNLGTARFVEVATGNDDVGFFRTLARGLGLGNLLRYKACDIRDRVESVLSSGDLVLVLDEAHRLWPQRNLRGAYPGRVVWIMKMANDGVPIAMISTPQFIEIQKAMEKNGWNSKQLTGRIKHYEPLPAQLSCEDLTSVAQAVLPEASNDALKALAAYAQNSARYLAAIDSIATRARYLAMKNGRSTTTTTDIRTAMRESVIPADNKLQAALEAGRKSTRVPLASSSEASAVQAAHRRIFIGSHFTNSTL